MQTTLAAIVAVSLGVTNPFSPVSAGNPDGVAEVMRALGYRAAVDVDEFGDPMIWSSASGKTFEIYFYGCEADGGCRDLLFSAGFDMPEPMSTDAMNSWNAAKLIGAAALDDEGDPYLRHMVIGADLMPAKSFERLVVGWDFALGQFSRFIEY